MIKKKQPFYDIIVKIVILTKDYTKKEILNMKKKTIIAITITILFSYDEKLKCSNSKGFLLTTI